MAVSKATVDRQAIFEIVSISPFGGSVVVSLDGKIFHLRVHDQIDLTMKTELVSQ